MSANATAPDDDAAVLGSATRLQLVHWESSVKLWGRHVALTTDSAQRAEALINLGNGYAAEGRAEQSAVVFRRALALVPVVVAGDKANGTVQDALRAHAHHSRAQALDQVGGICAFLIRPLKIYMDLDVMLSGEGWLGAAQGGLLAGLPTGL